MRLYTKEWRLNQINNLIIEIYKDDNFGYLDNWWKFYNTVEEFNKNQNITVATSVWKVYDETMLYCRPHNTKSGVSIHTSFIDSKK